MTEQLLADIGMKFLHQKDIVSTYAEAIRMGVSQTDWTKVNSAIIARWSESGLVRVKTMAWKQLEAGL